MARLADWLEPRVPQRLGLACAGMTHIPTTSWTPAVRTQRKTAPAARTHTRKLNSKTAHGWDHVKRRLDRLHTLEGVVDVVVVLVALAAGVSFGLGLEARWHFRTPRSSHAVATASAYYKRDQRVANRGLSLECQDSAQADEH